MKRFTTKILMLIVFSSCSSTKKNMNDLVAAKQLYGTWNHLEMRDYKGNNFKSSHNMPQITLNDDGTYEKKFTPVNTDSGYWKYNAMKMTIEYDLYIDSTDWIGKDLIKRGLAVKGADKRYYEKITNQLIKIEDSILIFDWYGDQNVYKKNN